MAKNNKTRFFYVLYSDKTRVFDQSERAYYPIYIIKHNKLFNQTGVESSYFSRVIRNLFSCYEICSVEGISTMTRFPILQPLQ